MGHCVWQRYLATRSVAKLIGESKLLVGVLSAGVLDRQNVFQIFCLGFDKLEAENPERAILRLLHGADRSLAT